MADKIGNRESQIEHQTSNIKNREKPMTAREAVMQAYLELGMTREDAELRGKYADGVIPDAVPFTDCPVKPGHERELVDYLKQLFRYMDAHPTGHPVLVEKTKWQNAPARINAAGSGADTP
ncbi:MAG TPA: hypothetical protein VN578_23960 [Candidatus Binatia bacterium]|nr:hypothetical protein [Candidatus Binatia bacterium]